MSAELIERDIVERHNALKAQLVGGAVAMCTALWSIRHDRTFRAEGCDSFGAFLQRSGISESTGRFYANMGPALLELQRTGEVDLVKHVEMLKPIHLMIAKAVNDRSDADVERVARTQAQIVRLAARVAKQGHQPLTAKLIERVAESNFRWVPARKRKAKKDAEIEPKEWEHPFRANVRKAIAVCQVELAGLNPDNAVHAVAVHKLPGFMDLAQWFADVTDIAARKKGLFE